MSRFVDASERLRSSLTTALPAALLDRRPFRPGAFFGKVGALEREIGRTRGGLSVRRLVEQYGEVIGAITPCVLVSPTRWPGSCRPGPDELRPRRLRRGVANHRGGRGRGARAGRRRGHRGRLEADTSVGVRRALDGRPGRGGGGVPGGPGRGGILTEAVHAGVGRLWLSWHYRSQDESLIAFSNAAYYENRRSTAHPAQSHDTGVSFTRVDGTFFRPGRGSSGPDKESAADQPRRGRGGRGRGAAAVAGAGAVQSAS